MRWWKAVGLAGAVGVAATGVVVARSERRRRSYTPDEIRARLHERLADGVAVESPSTDESAPPADGTATGRKAEPAG